MNHSSSCSLINLKNRGGLITPSDEIVKIVRVSETVLSEFLNRTMMSEKNLFQKIEILTTKTILQKYENILQLSAHLDDPGVWSIHRINLIKRIIRKYVSIRLKHVSRLKNSSLNERVRKKTEKLLHFKGQ